MYRHEAISIARQVMDRAGIKTELQPWVVDAILSAVNGTTKPEPLPLEQLAMTREQANTLLRKHLQGPMDPLQFDARILDAVLEAANRAKPWATYEQPCLDEACPCISNTDDIVAGDPESPIPPLYPVSAEPPPPVAWRRPAFRYTPSKLNETHWIWSNSPDKPTEPGDWQPLYAD
jgi:hypothetical protein